MHFTNVKSILLPGGGMNLYRGCTHNCIYCDSRSHCYDFKHDFEDIEVKANAAQLLDDTLRRKRKRIVIGTGAMSDSYIPLEQDLGHTRRALEIIERHGYGLAIQTKSASITRDTDLFERIRDKAKCTVQMTLTTYDEALCRIVEPDVSTTYERYQALKHFQLHNIPTVVWLTPILPFINDTEENIRGVIEYCADAGVYGILNFGMGMTLRSGSREYFYDKLDEHFPGLRKKYHDTYGLAYEIPSPHEDRLWHYARDLCARYGILFNNDEIFKYMHALPQPSVGEQLSFDFDM